MEKIWCLRHYFNDLFVYKCEWKGLSSFLEEGFKNKELDQCAMKSKKIHIIERYNKGHRGKISNAASEKELAKKERRGLVLSRNLRREKANILFSKIMDEFLRLLYLILSLMSTCYCIYNCPPLLQTFGKWLPYTRPLLLLFMREWGNQNDIHVGESGPVKEEKYPSTASDV